MEEQKLEPYYLNLFEVEYKKEEGFFSDPLLTEQTICYRIEDRILFLNIQLSQHLFLRILESLKSIKLIAIKHFNKEGQVVMKLDSDCEFINTPAFSCHYLCTGCMELKCSFVLKSLKVVELDQFNVTTSIKMF